MTSANGDGFGARRGARSRGPRGFHGGRGTAARPSARTFLPLLLLLAACPGPRNGGGGEVEDLRRAAALATGEPLSTWPASSAGRPVRLYVDRSGSMRGFLDPAYPARVRTDYRSVLDGFAARLRPAAVFGFGNEVRTAGEGGLEVLGNRGFYSDSNTELEEVLALVEEDSVLGSTHVIIGDGRRGDPDAANGQFVRMRRVAERWTEAGGTFIVAASHAPFKPVPGDRAGCRDAAGGVQPDSTCPLYAFAFVAPGDQGRVAAALAETFENLFVTPLPALPEAGVRLEGREANGITLEPRWTTAAGGAPIARVRAKGATNQPLRARVVALDTASPAGAGAWAALRGRRLVPRVSVRALEDDSAAAPWTVPEGAARLLRPTADPLALDFITRGAGRYLHRVELRPAGEPAWLEAYDAEGGDDTRRTYGLGRLFESFRAADAGTAPAALRLYVVVN